MSMRPKLQAQGTVMAEMPRAVRRLAIQPLAALPVIMPTA